MIRLFLFSALLMLASCQYSLNNESQKKDEKPEVNQGKQVIEKAIEEAGGPRYNTASISFDFRDLHYRISRSNGLYLMERTRIDSLDTIHDIVSNDGFIREVNRVEVSVPDSMVPRYSNSINSVFYFAQLPFGLNDAAVNTEYLGEAMINDRSYHKVKVFFDQEGGGEDHDDEFIYWVNKANNQVDYLAYEYATNGGGMRFREAYNRRTVNDIQFVDYINYKPKAKGSVLLQEVDEAYQNDQLKELSRIELKHVEVSFPSA